MSRILRRPMFRGGRVSSYGNGIATGLANGGRVNYATWWIRCYRYSRKNFTKNA